MEPSPSLPLALWVLPGALQWGSGCCVARTPADCLRGLGQTTSPLSASVSSSAQ